jgi:hypothetical protein
MKLLLVALALTIVLTPAFAGSAEREDTTLFFSFAELTGMLHHPAPALLDLRSAFRQQQKSAGQQGRIEKNFRWGNGLGFDSYAFPGTRPPLWGY